MKKLLSVSLVLLSALLYSQKNNTAGIAWSIKIPYGNYYTNYFTLLGGDSIAMVFPTDGSYSMSVFDSKGKEAVKTALPFITTDKWEIQCCAADKENNLYIATNNSNHHSPYSGAVFKVNSKGKLLWKKELTAAIGSVQSDRDNNLWIAGMLEKEILPGKVHLVRKDTNNAELFILKLNIAGEELSAISQTIEGMPASAEFAFSPTGQAFVCVNATVLQGADHHDLDLYSFDKNGKLEWSRQIQGASDLTFVRNYRMAFSSDRIYLCGMSSDTLGWSGVRPPRHEPLEYPSDYYYVSVFNIGGKLERFSKCMKGKGICGLAMVDNGSVWNLRRNSLELMNGEGRIIERKTVPQNIQEEIMSGNLVSGNSRCFYIWKGDSGNGISLEKISW